MAERIHHLAQQPAHLQPFKADRAMGWSFRKSVKMGPFRLNFSKSGVGASVGIKGLRFGVGPRGAQVSASAGGFQYRKSLGKRAPRATRAAGDVATAPAKPSGLSSLLGLVIVGAMIKCALDHPQQVATQAPSLAAVEQTPAAAVVSAPAAPPRARPKKRAERKPRKPDWLKSVKVAPDSE